MTVRKAAWLVLVVLCLVGVVLIYWGLRPPEQVRFDQGVRAYEAGDYSQALHHWQESLIDQPGDPVLYYNIGNAHYQQEAYDEAARFYSETPDEGPVEQWRKYNLGNALYRLGETNPSVKLERFAEALEWYKAAIIDDPGDLDAKINYEFVKKQLEEEASNQGDNSQDDGEDPQEEEQDQEGTDEVQEPASSSQSQPQDFGDTDELTYEEALRLLEFLSVPEGEIRSEPQQNWTESQTEYYW